MRRRSAVALALLFALVAPVAAQWEGAGGGGGSFGYSSSISAENPFTGRFLITVDDSPMWAMWLADSLAKVAADSGIVDDTWKPRASIGINTGILAETTDNGLYLFRGQNGQDGCRDVFAPGGVGPEDRCRLSLAEVLQVHRSGVIEICSHTALHKAVDPFTSIANEAHKWLGAYDSSSVEFAIVDPYRVMRDSLGIYLRTQLQAYHRGSVPEKHILSRWYVNARRAGLWNSGTTDFPTSTSGGLVGVARGSVLQLNHNVRDPINYLYASGDARAAEAWGPTYRGDRLMIPHANSVYVAGSDSAATATNLANIKWLMRYAAETKSTVTIVLHDQDNSNPATNPDLFHTLVFPGHTDTGKLGMVGIMDVLRYGTGLSKNGHDGREGPSLILSTVDDAMNARNGISHLAGPVNMIGNPRLQQSVCFPGTPWGWPASIFQTGGAVRDSGWGYVSPESVLVAGGFSGYDHEDLPGATAEDSARACGLIASVIASGNFKPFYLTAPVIPNSRAEFVFVWNASHVFRGASSAPDDSLADSRFEISVVGYTTNMDISDSTTAWVQLPDATGLTGDVGPLFAGALVPWSSFGTTNTNGGASAPDTSPFSLERTVSRAHMRDGSVSLRTSGYTGTYWGSASATLDAQQRWRESKLSFLTPPYVTGVRLRVSAVGFSAAAACTAKIALPELTCTQF